MQLKQLHTVNLIPLEITCSYFKSLGVHQYGIFLMSQWVLCVKDTSGIEMKANVSECRVFSVSAPYSIPLFV